MFNVAKPKAKQLFFDGDSLFSRGNGNLANAYSSPITAYNSLTGIKPPVFYMAVSGKSITQLISDFPTKMAPYINSGDIVVFNELTNELATVQNPNTVYNTLLSYRDLVWALGAIIIVGTMTARNTGYVGIETDRLSLNTLIRNNSNQFNEIADVGGLTEFNSIIATANLTNYDIDTLHFATNGYALQGATFGSKIQLNL